jgi:RHS repeat-associated protein
VRRNFNLEAETDISLLFRQNSVMSSMRAKRNVAGHGTTSFMRISFFSRAVCLICLALMLSDRMMAQGFSYTPSASTPWLFAGFDGSFGFDIYDSLFAGKCYASPADAASDVLATIGAISQRGSFIPYVPGVPVLEVEPPAYVYNALIPSYWGYSANYFLEFNSNACSCGLGTVLSDGSYIPPDQSASAPSQPYMTLGDKTCSTCPSYVGDPISLALGNMFEKALDYKSAEANPLSFVRYYNSMGDTNSAAVRLGQNWRSTYDRYLRITSPINGATTVIAERADGQEVSFYFQNYYNNPQWATLSDATIRLLPVGNGWVITNEEDGIETYGAENGGISRLVSIRARDGYTQNLEYDANDLLTNVSDSFGRSLQFAYQNGLLATTTAPNGLVVTYSYEWITTNATPSARLISAGYSTIPPTTQLYVYENTNLPFSLTGIIDENSNRFAFWTYDSVGRATSSFLAGGADLMSVTYNDDYGIRTVTNSLGGVSVYHFSTIQNVPKLIEIDRLATGTSEAATNLFTYDASGYLNSTSDWNANLTTMSNDYRGQPLTNNEAVGTSEARTITNIWHPIFHLPTQIAGPGKITDFDYDTNGNMQTRTETDTSTETEPYPTSGQSRTWSNTFGPFGEMLTSTGPRTDVIATISFGYDTNGDVNFITNALGQVTTFTNYNGSGLPLTIIDANGVVTELAYDVRDRLLQRTVFAASGNTTTTFAYDGVGQMTQITLPDGSFLAYQYDAAHRLRSVSNALGETIFYGLDPAGNIIQQSILSGDNTITKTQARVFDSLNRMIEDIGGNYQTNTYQYDGNGNSTFLTDGLNHATVRAFDALNRLISTIDPLQNTTDYGFDAQDNLTSVTDPREFTTVYTFDGFRRVIEENSPDKGITVYVLDEAGNRISQTDARGVVTLRTFDKLNRVTSEMFPASSEENIAYFYDSTVGGNFGVGRLTGYTDETGSTALVYNERGDVISKTCVIGGFTYSTSYDYDPAEHIVSITYPSGHMITFPRDSQGRICAAGYGGSALVTNVSYLPFGPVSAFAYGNGLNRTQIYDLEYRQNDIATGTGNHNIQNLTIGYDAANDITNIADNLSPARDQIFSYDADLRLVNSSGLYGAITYTYDGDGNRSTQTAGGLTQVYDYSPTANTLQSVVGGGVSRNFGYTLAGNMSSDNRSGTSNLIFTYGNRNRYNGLSQGASTIASYKYNAPGERLIKTIGATTTHFHYDEKQHLIAESQANGVMIREYVWLDDMPIAQIENDGTIYYIHPDHLNTPQKMTDANQRVVWDRAQQPFGSTVPFPTFASFAYRSNRAEATIEGVSGFTYVLQSSTNLSINGWTTIASGIAPFSVMDLSVIDTKVKFYRVVGSNSTVVQNLRFPGQYYDNESKLNYNLMRDYDSSTGRYMKSDPVGLRGGVNLYAYVNGNPVTHLDSTGELDPEEAFVIGELTYGGMSSLERGAIGRLATTMWNQAVIYSVEAGTAIAGNVAVGFSVGYLSEFYGFGPAIDKYFEFNPAYKAGQLEEELIQKAGEQGEQSHEGYSQPQLEPPAVSPQPSCSPK